MSAEAEERAKAFGEWVKSQRSWRRQSRAKLAAAAGISQAHLKSIEDGGRMMNGSWMVASPGDRVLFGLALALDETPTVVFEAAGVEAPKHLPAPENKAPKPLPPGSAAEGVIDVAGLPAEDVEMIEQQVRRLKRLHGLEE